MRRPSKTVCLILVALFSSPTFAELTPYNRNNQFYRPDYDPTVPRGLIFPEIFSLLLPGTDQWLEGEFSRATLYSGLALTGLGLRLSAQETADNRYKEFGTQIYLLAGSLSMFEAFRTAVFTRRSKREFSFTRVDETPSDVLLAPFNYRFLGRSTTLFPLMAAGIFYFLLAPKGGEDSRLSFGDVFYATSNGLMTGVTEECVFRGWMLPMLHETTNPAFAHYATAGTYALAHGIRFRHFITAFAFGLYSGWLVEKNDWTISEGIFIHAWWDVMAFMADYATHQGHAFLRIPPLYIRF